MSLEHVLKNSSVADKRPTPAQLANGEISINWNAEGAFLCCKDTAGNIQQVGGVKISETVPADPVKGTAWLRPSTSTLGYYDGSTWTYVTGGGGGGGVSSVSGTAPITSSGGLTPTIAITPATTAAAGSMSAADKTKLDGLSAYTLPEASATTLGGVMVGDNLVIAAGVLSAQLPGALIYKGGIDLTTTAPAALAAGHTYVNTVAGVIHASWTGITGTAAVGDMVLWSGTKWDRVGSSGFGVTSVTGAAPITIAGTAAAPEVGIRAATTTVTGAVQLATAAETTTGTLATKAVTPAGLKVELDKKAPLDSPALTGTPTAPTAAAGTNTTQVATTEFVTGVVTALTGSATAPTSPTTGQVWIDNSKIPSVTNVWNGTAWVPQAGATISSATAPTTPATGTVWVNTSVTPNVTQIWDGTAWVTATPDKASAAAIAADAKYATKAEVQAEDLWDRTGTEISPKTAGDVIGFSTGTAALPGLAVVGDANTGFYAPAADQLGVSLGGVGKIIFGSWGSTLSSGGYYVTSDDTNAGAVVVQTAGGAERTILRKDGSAYFAKDVTIGGTGPSAPNIKLKADGGFWGSGAYTRAYNGVDVAQLLYDPGRDAPTEGAFVAHCYGNDGASPILASAALLRGATAWSAYTSESRLKDFVADPDPDQCWTLIRDIELKRYYYKDQDDKTGVSYMGPMADWLGVQDPELLIDTGRTDEHGPIHTYNQGLLDMKALAALSAALKRIEALETEVAALKAAPTHTP